ncbi:MAG: hypothetical protein JW829_10780 [Pirellulales bacterium]|nr:hypothetical protein [Pirellulales bacterium]
MPIITFPEQTPHFQLLVCLLAAFLLVPGCSDQMKTGDVTGNIQVDGQPARTGSIAFIPVDGKSPTAGAEILGGQYSAKVPLGEVKVEIRVSKVVGHKKLYDTPNSPIQPILEEVLPEKYNNQTELQMKVEPGKNQKDFDLKTK